MADILKIYTKEQLYVMYRSYILAKDVGLTDFNEGSRIRTLLESDSEIISSVSMDFKEALYKAIPIALYQGFGFSKLGAVKATGSLRIYREPLFYVEYTGAGTSAKITSGAAIFASAVTGAPADAFSLAYVTYATVESLVNAIDALANWSATLVKSGSAASTGIYQYTAKEAVAATNYLNADGLDITLQTDAAITINEGFSVSIDNLTILTTADGSIAAGETSAAIACEVQTAGTGGNLAASAIDTKNGKGSINSSIDGVEQVRNDSAFSGGDTAETDAERKTRFSETVNSLNAGTESGIIAAIKGVSGVRSVGMRTSYPFKGTNTILVDDGSGTISATLQAAVEKVLYGDANDYINYPGKNVAGMGYNISAPTIVPVDLGIIVYRLPNINVDLTEIGTDVKTAIEQYVNTRSLGQDVLLSEVVRVGKNSNAAAYDLIVNSPASNKSIAESEFAKTGSGTGGTVTVTVSVSTTE